MLVEEKLVPKDVLEDCMISVNSAQAMTPPVVVVDNVVVAKLVEIAAVEDSTAAGLWAVCHGREPVAEGDSFAAGLEGLERACERWSIAYSRRIPTGIKGVLTSIPLEIGICTRHGWRLSQQFTVAVLYGPKLKLYWLHDLELKNDK
jgi:hypothetical protein